MKVYHGSTTIVEKPLVSVGRNNLDFGQGFYVTEIKEQAISWARRPSNEGKPQVLNVYELDINGILAHNYKRLKHEHPNNQICILRQEIIDQFLHFSDAKQI
ncbi:MAG: DUF3990 domain-containing protein [Bacteroidales bacterium]|nr:DUF3990 domain-containing protein [Bacteroidales bacterium]